MNQPSLHTNLTSCFHNTISKQPHFLKWKAEMHKTTPNGRVSSNQDLVHVIKESGDQRLDSCSTYSAFNLITSAVSPQFRYARATGYFLVLPLIAFCIRCITGALHHRVFGAPKHQTETELLETLYPGSYSKRWKSALRDLDPDAIDCVSRPDSDHFGDEDHQSHDKDNAKAYMELERDYQKFLSQCGLSGQGYLRGGSK